MSKALWEKVHAYTQEIASILTISATWENLHMQQENPQQLQTAELFYYLHGLRLIIWV